MVTVETADDGTTTPSSSGLMEEGRSQFIFDPAHPPMRSTRRVSTPVDQAPATPQATAGMPFDLSNMTTDQETIFSLFQMMAAANAQAYKTPASAITAPRVGGVSKSGAWTGLGMSQAGEEPSSYYCMREFTSEGPKELAALGKIKEHCKAGLSLKESGPLFSLSYEKETHPLVSCIKAMLKHIEECGMEGVFMIERMGCEPIHMFKNPAQASLKIINDWILDLTVNGVTDGKGGRHPLCPHDKTNLRTSGQALLNSCSLSLHDEVLRQVPDPKELTGPRVYYEIVQLVATLSISYTRDLENQLRNMSLKKIKGESVTQYGQQAMKIVDEIRMTALLPELVPDLASLVLMGLNDASDDTIRAQSILAMAACDDLVNHAGAHTRQDPAKVLAPLVRLYAVMDQRGIYGPSKTTKSVQAMQAEVKELKKKSLEMVDMSSGQDQRETTRKCFECGATGHIKSNCPELKKKSSGSGSNRSSSSSSSGSGKSGKSGKSNTRYKIPGLSDKENEEVDTLIKDKISSLKPLSDVSDGAKHEIKYKNKVVAKFCKTCKRFLKGDKAHFTSEHKSKKDAGTSPSSSSAASANVVIVEPSVDEAPVAPALMRCEAVDYDTPALPSHYDAFLGDSPDDASIDSAYNAFMAVPSLEGPPTPEGPPGPWFEVIPESDFVLVAPKSATKKRPKGRSGQVL
jgi:hypothetical protein